VHTLGISLWVPLVYTLVYTEESAPGYEPVVHYFKNFLHIPIKINSIQSTPESTLNKKELSTLGDTFNLCFLFSIIFKHKIIQTGLFSNIQHQINNRIKLHFQSTVNFSQFNFIGKHGHFMHFLSIQSRNNHVIRSHVHM